MKEEKDTIENSYCDEDILKRLEEDKEFYKSYKRTRRRNTLSEIFTIRNSVYLIGIVGFVLLVVGACTANKEKSPEEIRQEQERADCRSRSNTYQKCSWNVWENRCTCKLR